MWDDEMNKMMTENKTGLWKDQGTPDIYLLRSGLIIITKQQI